MQNSSCTVQTEKRLKTLSLNKNLVEVPLEITELRQTIWNNLDNAHDAENTQKL